MAVILFLIAILAIGGGASAARLSPSPQGGPTIQPCIFFPDPRLNVSFDCGADNTFQPAFVNLSVRFAVNVSDPASNSLHVTFYFDYLNSNGSVNPNSPTRVINVTSPGPGIPVTVETAWNYTDLNGNFTVIANQSSLYWVNVDVRNETGEVSTTGPFPVTVNENSEPFINGWKSVYSILQPIQPNDPQIPLVYVNVSVGDPDSDPLIVTWDWGDGTQSVNRTGPLTEPQDLNVTHPYAASAFPLNESLRTVRFTVRVWLDDGVGHNVSESPSVVEYYIGPDSPPRVTIVRPELGSLWKVGENVYMEGNVSDPEGGPTTAFWDFDNRTDSDGDGDPARDRDANTTMASHVYPFLGQYNVTLWATDGETKVTCIDPVNCTSNATGYQSHWTSRTFPIFVRYNIPPFLALSSGAALKNEPVLLRADVLDTDGDNMTVTWIFDDGTPTATNFTGNSSRPSTQVFRVFQPHSFSSVGPHNVTVIVSDGNATLTNTTTVFVESFNLPPDRPSFEILRADGTLAEGNSFRLNETVLIRVNVSDPENDSVEVHVDWGDGNTNTTQVDFATAQGCGVIGVGNVSKYVCTLTFSHRYTTVGSVAVREFSVLVTVADHEDYYDYDPGGGSPVQLNHAPSLPVTVIVTNYEQTGLGPWDWWDYSALAAVVGIPGIIIGRWAVHVRRERREE